MLFKKARRAMWRHKKSYLACVFLIMLSTLIYTAYGTASAGLRNSVWSFYENYRLADVWANVGAIPISEVERLRGIPGIADVDHRSTMEVRAEIEGNDDIIILRLISFDPGADSRINDFHFVNGFEPGFRNDMALSFAFHDYHGFEPSDGVRIFAYGVAHDFEISGAFLVPEFVYIVRGGTDLMPNHRAFGLAYITEESMESLTGRVGTANQVLFTLMPGYEFEDVQFALQDALAPYGLISVHDRGGNFSYAMMDMYVPLLENMAVVLPMTFILMAVFVLYLMLKRIIEQERTQIGTLKAFGKSNGAILRHYMAYGGITGFIGGLLGYLGGGGAAEVYLTMFLEFFAVPALMQPVGPMYLVFCLAIGMGGGILGALMGALKALRLSPAEAMRPETPKPIKYDIVGKMGFLKYILHSRGQMAIRSIIRTPFRSIFTVVGVTFGFMLLTVFGDMERMMDILLYSQFEEVRTYDMRVALNQPVPLNQAVAAAYNVRYVTQAEGLWELPVTLSYRHLREGAVITGVQQNGQLFRIFDTARGVVYPPSTDGLIITNGLADALNVRAGDILYISTFLAENDIPVPVTRVIEQNVGTGAFMDITALSGMVGQPAVANSLMINAVDLDYVAEYFTQSPLTGTVESVDATLQQYIDMMAPFSAVYTMMYFMGIAIAFAIIYNTSTIALSERQREFATLRVLGLTNDEVCEIMRFEYWLLATIGMIIGIPLSVSMMLLINSAMDTTMMSMPTIISAQAYVMAAAGSIIAITLSNLSAKRKISKFNMVEVLKERE